LLLNSYDGHDARSLLNAFCAVGRLLHVTDGFRSCFKARLHLTFIDGKYYREVLPKKQLLPVMRRIAVNTFVFQQASAPVHRAREIVQLLEQETLDFISPDLWPPSSPLLNY